MQTEVLKVSGMTCNHCKHSVETALKDLPGVVNAVVDLAKGEVAVETNSAVSKDAYREAIEEAGYELAQ